MDFRVIFIEICFSIFIWFWFSYLWNLPWSFVFDIYFVKFECRVMLALRWWKNLLFATCSNWAFSWVFCKRFIVFEYHFNSLLLTTTTGVWYETPCFSVSPFVENSYLTFNLIQLTGCHEKRDLGVRNLEANYQQIYIFSFFV